MLAETLASASGLSLLQGPSLSGKTTLIRTFVEDLDPEQAVAVVDGKGLNTTHLLLSMLRQFGYEIELSSANELSGLVRMFALQQAAANVPPLLIVENVAALNPSALRTLNELAELRVRTGPAIRIVLSCQKSLGTLLKTPAMETVARRLSSNFHLRPMSCEETRHYVHEKLLAAGALVPEAIFPDSACQALWVASGGWPGIADRLALLALARARALPVRTEDIERPSLPEGTWEPGEQDLDEDLALVPPQPPRLIVTNHGSVIATQLMDKPRLLIGRSEHNDIGIPSRFISRHHALLVRHGNTTILMDLNSTNGTFVNAARVSNHVLAHDDVITIGHHKIKFTDPFATRRPLSEMSGLDDTVIMKTLEDMRNLLARENTALLPTASEDLPTILT